MCLMVVVLVCLYCCFYHHGNISVGTIISSFLHLYSKQQDWCGIVKSIMRVSVNFSRHQC